MTNEELFTVLKSFAAKANEKGTLNFDDALDLVTRSQNEVNRVEDCVKWFCEVRDEIIDGKKKKQYPHAAITSKGIYNSQVVKAYADAYAIASNSAFYDTSEDYSEVHSDIAKTLAIYFDGLYMDYLSERFGDDFDATLKEFKEGKEKDELIEETKKKLRSAKQSLARLEKGNDADKIAEAKKHLSEVEAKAKALGILDDSKSDSKKEDE